MILVPSKMGQLNRRALLACLQRLGTASRAELAKESQLSSPTVGKIADELIKQGIIEETGPISDDAAKKSRRVIKTGRPGRCLRLNQKRPRFLGIHLDVRETRFSQMAVHPKPEDSWDWVVPTPTGPEELLELLRHAEARFHANQWLGIILSVPGILDEDAGRVLFSPNLHWTENVSLPGVLHEVWPIPVVLVQELRSLALGHNTFDTSGEDFLAVDIGEGVGGTAIVGGRPYTTQLPMSGELGHTQVEDCNRSCGCGAVGCLETLVSRSGLLGSFANASGETDVELEQLKACITTDGVPPWLAETLYRTGTIVAGALNVLGIKKVIITGVLNELPDSVHADLRKAISGGALWQRFGEVTCVFGPRHHTAGMVAVGLDRVVMPSNPGVPLAHLPAAPRRMTG